MHDKQQVGSMLSGGQVGCVAAIIGDVEWHPWTGAHWLRPSMIDDMKSARLEARCPSTARLPPLPAMRSAALSASISSASLMKLANASPDGGTTETRGDE